MTRARSCKATVLRLESRHFLFDMLTRQRVAHTTRMMTHLMTGTCDTTTVASFSRASSALLYCVRRANLLGLIFPPIKSRACIWVKTPFWPLPHEMVAASSNDALSSSAYLHMCALSGTQVCTWALPAAGEGAAHSGNMDILAAHDLDESADWVASIGFSGMHSGANCTQNHNFLHVFLKQETLHTEKEQAMHSAQT